MSGTAPAAPAAAAPAVTPAAAQVSDSLIPSDPAAPATPAAPAAAAPAAAAPAAPATPAAPAAPAAPVPPTADNIPKWFYSDGTPGKGDPPSWFKSTKYKNVEEQAKAYPQLESRMGAFVGAPEGDYEFKLPDGVSGELDKDNPLLGEFSKWAKSAQLSQEGFNSVLGMFAKYEAEQVASSAEVSAAIGENAGERITAVASWAKANLDTAAYQQLRFAMAPNQDSAAERAQRTAAVFAVIEAVINKTRQPALPKPGQDVAAAQPQGLAGINAMAAVLGPDGKPKILSDPAYRAQYERALQAHFSSQAAA